ncbi:MAG TPA: hypothetical protein VHA79_11835 [Mycobacteriales bacterium]|jgi:hypothetical protein|nr:hypothetical protein [Mycobacteriales bacterium]HVX70368.1 hypothetical protein [Mycobacteriales bacterium]
MSDITDLFRSISPDTPEPDAATIEGDLARGRTALVRAHRRSVVRRSVFATGTLAVGVVVAVAATQTGGGSAATNDAGPAHHIKAHHAASAVNLVAYTGKQLEGFTVDRVPAGWHLSTSTQYALLVTANGSTDDDPSVFVDKLAVLTSSADEHGLGPGDPVTVNGQPGHVDNQAGTLILRYNAPNGFGIDIQAPPALHWTADQLVSFAEGVHVTGDAVHARG